MRFSASHLALNVFLVFAALDLAGVAAIPVDHPLMSGLPTPTESYASSTRRLSHSKYILIRPTPHLHPSPVDYAGVNRDVVPPNDAIGDINTAEIQRLVHSLTSLLPLATTSSASTDMTDSLSRVNGSGDVLPRPSPDGRPSPVDYAGVNRDVMPPRDISDDVNTAEIQRLVHSLTSLLPLVPTPSASVSPGYKLPRAINSADINYGVNTAEIQRLVHSLTSLLPLVTVPSTTVDTRHRLPRATNSGDINVDVNTAEIQRLVHSLTSLLPLVPTPSASISMKQKLPRATDLGDVLYPSTSGEIFSPVDRAGMDADSVLLHEARSEVNTAEIQRLVHSLTSLLPLVSTPSTTVNSKQRVPRATSSDSVFTRSTLQRYPSPVEYLGVDSKDMLLDAINNEVNTAEIQRLVHSLTSLLPLTATPSVSIDKAKEKLIQPGGPQHTGDKEDHSKRRNKPFWSGLPMESSFLPTKLNIRGPPDPIEDTDDNVQPNGHTLQDNVNHLEDGLGHCSDIRPLGAIWSDAMFACYAHMNFDLTQRFKCFARDSVCFHQYMLVREHNAQICYDEERPCTRKWADCYRLANTDKHRLQKVKFWEYCNAQTGFVWQGVDMEEFRLADKIKIDNFWHIIPPAASQDPPEVVEPPVEPKSWTSWNPWGGSNNATVPDNSTEPFVPASPDAGPETETRTQPGSYIL